jgi:hypothetical protein
MPDRGIYPESPMKRIPLSLRISLLVVVAAGTAFLVYCLLPGEDPLLFDPVLAVRADAPATAELEHKAAILTMAEASRGLEAAPAVVTIDYPLDGSIFPPEIVPPTFLWHDETPDADRWLIDVSLSDDDGHVYVMARGIPQPRGPEDPRTFGATNERYMPTVYQAAAKSWTPDEEVWAAIKAGSVDRPATVTITGFNSRDPESPLSRGAMAITTSTDRVDAPIFYRDVPLMPAKNEQGVIRPVSQYALPFIGWRLKDISRDDSRLVLTDMASCGNCHSFSLDGKTLGMDIDGPGGDKGAYAVAPSRRR